MSSSCPSIPVLREGRATLELTLQILTAGDVAPYTQVPMKPTSFALYAGSVWQILRFAVLATFVLVVMFPEICPGFNLILIWPATAELSLAAAFFFLARNASRYGAFRNLLILGKVLDVVPGLLLLAYQTGASYLKLGPPLVTIAPALDLLTGTSGRSAMLFYYLLVLVVLLDLIFLFVLVSLRVPVKKKTADTLPELSAIDLEDV